MLRRFAGVNIAVDSAFVDPSFLQSSRNFVPDTTYLLIKRRGTVFFGTPFGVVDIIRAVYDAAGTLFLFWVVSEGTGDRIGFFTEDGTNHVITNGTFASAGKRYDMAVLGGDLYVGNGIDPIKQIPLTNPTTAIDLVEYPAAEDIGQTATLTPDAASVLLNGTYAYRWCLFNKPNKRWDAIGPVHTITMTAVSDMNFTAPGPLGGIITGTGVVAITPDQEWHLFVAVANAAIETATDQKTDGFAASATFTMSSITVDGPVVPIPSSVMRSGRFFISHLNRIWFAVGSRVFATDVIVPGLEQQVFDQGTFFPADATFSIEDDGGGDITALFVATVTSTNDSPSAPVIVATESSCWGWFGDILSDPNANRVKLSGRVGCIAQQTAVPTPIGTIFCGLDSVYLIRPDTLVPIDIGWPIAPSIKAIPVGRRAFACAYYHQGFYKLAITPRGGAENTIQWWLDLHQAVITGQIESTPSWWGPHVGLPMRSFTSALKDSHEFDRGYGAAEGARVPNGTGGVIYWLDQPNVYTEGNAPVVPPPTGNERVIVSQILTKAIDGGMPFDDKIVTRVQANGRVPIETFLQLSVVVDDMGFTGFFSSVTGLSELVFPDPGGAIWNISEWNIAEWGVETFEEAITIAPPGRPRGRQIVVRATHPAPQPPGPPVPQRQITGSVQLRDFQLTYLPVQRPIPTFPPTTPP